MTSTEHDHPTQQPSVPVGPSAKGTEPPPPSTQELDAAKCWARLREASVGRLAVVVERRPDIYPVNYVVDAGTVVFRTASGAKLASSDGQMVAFEVDAWDDASGTVWSVVVKGRAARAREPYEVLDALSLPLTPWHSGSKPWFVRIEPSTITGRQFTRAG